MLKVVLLLLVMIMSHSWCHRLLSLWVFIWWSSSPLIKKHYPDQQIQLWNAIIENLKKITSMITRSKPLFVLAKCHYLINASLSSVSKCRVNMTWSFWSKFSKLFMVVGLEYHFTFFRMKRHRFIQIITIPAE